MLLNIELGYQGAAIAKEGRKAKGLQEFRAEAIAKGGQERSWAGNCTQHSAMGGQKFSLVHRKSQKKCPRPKLCLPMETKGYW